MDQLGYNYNLSQLKDFKDTISVPFDPVDYDWTLRLLLGHCVSFTFPKAKFNNIKMQNIVNDNLRNELKTAQPNVIESIRENLAKLTEAITQNRLFYLVDMQGSVVRILTLSNFNFYRFILCRMTPGSPPTSAWIFLNFI